MAEAADRDASDNTDHQVPSGDLIAEARAALERGDGPSARQLIRQALELAPTKAETWYYLALTALAQGDQHLCQLALRRAFRVGLDIRQLSFDRLYRFFIVALGETAPRLAEITRPCPILGPAREQLSREAEATLDQIFAAHLQKFLRTGGEGLDLLPGPPPKIDYAGKRVLLIQNDRIGGNPACVRSDVADCYDYSAARHGHIVQRSAVSHLLLLCQPEVQQPHRLGEGLAELAREIDSFRPDLILLDGNFSPSFKTIQPGHARRLTPPGCHLVVTVPDYYDSQPNFLEAWGEAADLVAVQNFSATHSEASAHRDKLFYWPGLPFEPDWFAPKEMAARRHGLCVLGSLNRGREIFAELLKAHGVPGFYSIHDRRNHDALAADDYRAALCDARLIFNNGYITSAESIITGRFFEGILAGGVVMEEIGSDAGRLFVPYVHYVPFANIDQVIALAQYLLARPDLCHVIAARARAWYLAHMSGRAFWAHLWSRLCRR